MIAPANKLLDQNPDSLSRPSDVSMSRPMKLGGTVATRRMQKYE
jgi:hypothetical protein